MSHFWSIGSARRQYEQAGDMAVERGLASTGWAVLYGGAVVVGRSWVLPETGLALFWPAAGVVALWMVWAREGGRWWPHVVALGLVAAVGQALLGVGVVGALLLACANVTQGVAYALVARRAGLEESATRNVLRVALGAAVSAPLGAVVGVVGAVANGAEPTALLAVAWVVRNACATFMVVTLVIAARGTWRRGGRLPELLTTRGRGAALPEYAAAFVLTAAVAAWVFGTPGQRPLTFVVVITSVWVGSRFSPFVAAAHSMLLGIAVGVTSSMGLGPFGVVTDLGDRSLLVQLFVLVNSAVTQLLAAGLRDRHRLLERALRSEEEVRGQKAVLDTVLDTMQDGLVVIDDRGQVIVHNAAARRLGGPADGDPTMPVRSATAYGLSELDGASIDENRRPFAEALAGNTVKDRVLLREDPVTGRRGVLSVNASPLSLAESADGTRRLAVVSMRDVTEEHAYVRDLEGFTGMVAHDLRGPLAAAMSWAEIVDDQLDELPVDASAARTSLLRVYGSNERAMQLVQELLDYARSGDQPLDPQDVDLSALLDTVVSELSQQPSVTGSALPRAVHGAEAQTQPTTCGWVTYTGLDHVRGDAVLLGQLFTNLLANARKYVAPGVTPHIEVRSRRETDDRVERVVVDVADNGIGIDPASRSRVFETFYRAPTDGDFPGTGLGLAICARIAQRHGGDIAALENPATGGTTIRLRLPAADEGAR